MRLLLHHDTFGRLAFGRWSTDAHNPRHANKTFIRRFKCCHGTTHEQIAECWNRLAVASQLPNGTRPIDLLDAFHYMKNYGTWESTALALQRDEKTLRAKMWELMEIIAMQQWVSYAL